MGRVKSSNLWNFYDPLHNKQAARCKFCKSVVSCKDFNTSGLKKHLKSMHKSKFADVDNLVLKDTDPAPQAELAEAAAVEGCHTMLFSTFVTSSDRENKSLELNLFSTHYAVSSTASISNDVVITSISV